MIPWKEMCHSNYTCIPPFYRKCGTLFLYILLHFCAHVLRVSDEIMEPTDHQLWPGEPWSFCGLRNRALHEVILYCTSNRISIKDRRLESELVWHGWFPKRPIYIFYRSFGCIAKQPLFLEYFWGFMLQLFLGSVNSPRSYDRADQPLKRRITSILATLVDHIQ